MDYDPGPPSALAQHFAALPSYASKRDCFWYDWGPIFYRGRLDGSARILGIASDPGPTERIAARTLVGDAGQRVQGFLTKLGLTRSYALVNAYALALLPSKAPEARPLLADPQHKAWRNRLYDDITGPALQAIVAFGTEAQRALHLWDSKPAVPAFEVPHPSSHNTPALLLEWRQVIPQLRDIVDPDPDGDASGPNYGTNRFEERDYARIPHADLPFGMPAWFGDDSWGRNAHPQHNTRSSVPAPICVTSSSGRRRRTSLSGPRRKSGHVLAAPRRPWRRPRRGPCHRHCPPPASLPGTTMHPPATRPDLRR